jgi:hypothetical protein
VGTRPYIHLLTVVRRFRSIKRKVLRRLPDWVRDTLDWVRYVNFLRLLPLVVALLFVPSHFWRRLPRTIAGKSDLFSRPLPTMTTFASLLLALASRFGLSVSEWEVLGILIIASVTAPVWTLIFVGMFYYLLSPVPSLRRWVRPIWNDQWFRLFASYKALKQLQLGMYMYGLFYYVFYFVITFTLVGLLALAAGLISMVIAYPRGGSEDRDLSSLLSYSMMTFSLVGAVVLIRPLAELFKACLRVPSPGAFAMDLEDVNHLLKKALRLKGRGRAIPYDLVSDLRVSFRSLLITLVRQEKDIIRRQPTSRSLLLQERARACVPIALVSTLLFESGAVGYFAEVDRTLISSLDALLAGKSLVPALVDSQPQGCPSRPC